MSGVPNLYTTKCKICDTNLKDKEMKLVNLEQAGAYRKRYGFVCIDCWAIGFDDDNNKLP